MKVSIVWVGVAFFVAWPLGAGLRPIAAQQLNVSETSKTEILAKERQWMQAIFDKRDAQSAVRQLFPHALIFAPLPVPPGPTTNGNSANAAYATKAAVLGSDLTYKIDPASVHIRQVGDVAVVRDSFIENATNVKFNEDALKGMNPVERTLFVAAAISRIKEAYGGRFQQMEVWTHSGSSWTLAAAEVAPATTTHGLDCEVKE